MSPLISQILLAFLFITLGFIVGAVIAVMWSERDRKANPPEPAHGHEAPVTHKAPAPAPEKAGHFAAASSIAAAPAAAAPVSAAPAAAAPVSAAPAAAAPVSAAPAAVTPPEMALLRDPASGKLSARFDAKLFHSAQELNAAEREQAIKLTREWVAWLGDGKEAAPAAPSADATGHSTAAAHSADITSHSATAEPVSDATGHSAAMGEAHRPAAPAGLTPMAEAQPMTSSQYPAQPVMTPPPPPPPVSQPTQTAAPGKGGKAAGKQADAKPAAPVSIVGQIDEILQEMLHKAPADFPGVRLVEDLKNGVVVWVGVEHFNGIDAVTDPRAKELIKAAVAEWERRADRERK